ncbi:hypothetical protein C8R46DRAFT_1363036 [Mycena filopes]|nr:hypothetical protein C8R46DRAFT_1363036 [Mycena filopes]
MQTHPSSTALGDSVSTWSTKLKSSGPAHADSLRTRCLASKATAVFFTRSRNKLTDVNRTFLAPAFCPPIPALVLSTLIVAFLFSHAPIDL